VDSFPDRVGRRGPALDRRASTPFTTSATGSWLFWIDSTPGKPFGHAVQYVIVDASRSDPAMPSARFTREAWWPVVRLSGSAAAVPLLPASAFLSGVPTQAARGPAAGEPCLVSLAGPGAPADRVAELFAHVGGTVFAAPTREGLGEAVAEAAAKGCGAAAVHIAAHGFAPRTGAAVRSAGSFGGVVLADASGAPADFVDHAEIAKALQPLAGTKLSLILEAPFAENALHAYSGIGLAGEALAGNGDAFANELLRRWGAALEAGRTFELRDLLSSSAVRAHWSALAPGGPRALPVPDFSLAAGGVFETASLALPDGLPRRPLLRGLLRRSPHRRGRSPAVRTRGLPAAPHRFRRRARRHTYSLRLTAGGTSYEGRGTIAVGQEMSCSPSRLWLVRGFPTELRLAPGAFYDPSSTARVLPRASSTTATRA